MLADLVGSCVLVAVRVVEDPEVGAVKAPPEVMEPAEADHVTAVDGLPVPATVAPQVMD